MQQIGPKETADLYTAAEIDRRQIDEDSFNPFEAADTDTSARYRYTEKSFNRFIGNLTNPVLQGQRLRKVYEHCVIRRTYASHVPRDNPEPIAVNIPKLHGLNIDCPFNDAQLKIYRDEYDVVKSALVTKDPRTMKIRFSFGKVRYLVLMTDWLPLRFIHRKLRAKTIKSWLTEPNIVYKLMQEVKKEDAEYEVPEQSPAAILAKLLQDAPKLRALLHDVGEVVVKGTKKLAIYAQYPAAQILLYGVFQLLKIDARVFHSDLSLEDREKIRHDFTQLANKAMVFITTYAMATVGLNLQELCHHVAHFDPPPNESIWVQANGRFRRLKSKAKVVYTRYYHVPATFADRLVALNFTKVIPTIITELQLKVGTGDEEGGYSVDIGQFVLDGDVVYPVAHPDVVEKNLPILEPVELMHKLMGMIKGERVSIGAW